MTRKDALSAPPPRPPLAPRRLRVLVADDEHDAVLTLSALLRDDGHQVRGVFRGDAVLEAVYDFAPEVLLLDIGMPHMSGYEVARALRERYGSARPVLVAVTGRAGDFDRRLAKLAGFDHFIAKPYAPAALLALLARISAA